MNQNFKSDTYWVNHESDLPIVADQIAKEWNSADITVDRILSGLRDMAAEEFQGYIWYGEIMSHKAIGYVVARSSWNGQWRGDQHLTIFTPESNFFAQGIGMGGYYPGFEELSSVVADKSDKDEVRAAYKRLTISWMVKTACKAFKLSE